MKIIFLDFDGVLNCHTTTQRYHGILGIEPRKVALVQRILDQTGARIVISSTWRLLHPLRELRELLQANGLRNAADVVIGITPRIVEGPDGTIQVSRPRGEEIMAWLRYGDNRGSIDAFVVLDDERVDVLPLIRTTTQRGLLPSHVQQAVNWLNGPRSTAGNGQDVDSGTSPVSVQP